jgi:acyl-CoA thioester hydrolase
VTEPFRHALRVRYNECDPQGVVFNANYLTYFDLTMTELWRGLGGYGEMVEAGMDMVVAEATIRYLDGLRFDEHFEVRATITRLGETSMTTEFDVVRTEAGGNGGTNSGSEEAADYPSPRHLGPGDGGSGATVALGTLRHVFVSADGSGKRPIPDAIRTGLAPYTTH